VRRTAGFTLTELLIAMLLALFLLSMVLTAFSSLSRSVRQAQQLSELQQNAQLVMSLFQNELTNTGFWGGRSDPMLAVASPMPASPAPDCVEDTLDSGSFPQAGRNFVTLYASRTAAGRQLNCITQTIPDSELLQVKRLVGQLAMPTEMRQNRFYLETDWQHSRFVDSSSHGLNAAYDYFPYQHLVFYLQLQRVDGNTVPVLMRKRLARNQVGSATISTDSVLDGVERMHFEFGVDTNLNGQLNYFLPTQHMAADFWWQKNSRIISIRYYVLLRARQPDPGYINNQHYDMGGSEFIAPGDHYRRLLVSSSIFFQNAALQEGS
jgi:type IV pilus assembly protein PilW